MQQGVVHTNKLEELSAQSEALEAVELEDGKCLEESSAKHPCWTDVFLLRAGTDTLHVTTPLNLSRRSNLGVPSL